jgi:hypothetical protein
VEDDDPQAPSVFRLGLWCADDDDIPATEKGELCIVVSTKVGVGQMTRMTAESKSTRVRTGLPSTFMADTTRKPIPSKSHSAMDLPTTDAISAGTNTSTKLKDLFAPREEGEARKPSFQCI